MLRVAWPALVLALLLAPTASAGFAPALYYLAPGTDATSGALSQATPQGDEASSAVVTALPADLPSASFVALEGPNATHVKGRVLVGLWADLAAAQGSVEARFVLVNADGKVTPVAAAARPVSLDPSHAPEPTALLPPDPTDPQGAVFHVAMQVLPLLAKPPVLLDLGILDVEVPEGAVAGVELRLVEDNATGVPAAGLARVSYGAALSPSFVYVPWWSEDPPAAPGAPPPSPNPQPSPGGPAGGGGGDADDPEPRSEGKDSPAASLLLVVVALGAVLVLRRR